MSDTPKKTKAELIDEIHQLEKRIQLLKEKKNVDWTKITNGYTSGRESSNDRSGSCKSRLLEEELREKKILREKIIDNAAVGMWTLNDLGNLTKINPKAQQLFNISEKELLSTYNIFQDPFLKKQGFMPQIQDVFERGKVTQITLDYTLQSPDQKQIKKKSLKSLHLAVAPILLHKGKVTKVMVQALDLTEMKEKENELLRSQTLLEAAINSPKDVAIMALNREYNYIFLNQHHFEAIKATYGSQPQVGDHIFDHITETDTVAKAQEDYDRALAGESHSNITEGYQGDVYRYYENYFYPIHDDQTKIVGVVLYGYNITERILAEKALKEKQKEFVENAHKAGMADIATEVIHNIGNVLNSVMTSTHLLAEHLEKSPINNLIRANQLITSNMANIKDFLINNPKGKKLMEYYLWIGKDLEHEKAFFEKNIDRIFEKVNVIREIVASQQHYTTEGYMAEEVGLSDIINDVLTNLENELHQAGVTVEKHFSPSPPILVNKTKLIYVITNLLKNAQEALDTRPPDKRKITIVIEHTDYEIVCKIIDQGIGIRKENLIKVFAHGFTTKKNSHGFGLHKSANYMFNMGGEIAAESKGENMGATFKLKFFLKQDTRVTSPPHLFD